MKTGYSFDLKQKVNIAIQVCETLLFLQQNKVAYSNWLKPKNILLVEDEVKIINWFTPHAIYDEGATLIDLTIELDGYVSPEQIMKQPVANSDVFSLGVIFYQLFTWMESSPFYSKNYTFGLEKICNEKLPLAFTRETAKTFEHIQISKLLESALQKDFRFRMSSVEVMLSEWKSVFPYELSNQKENLTTAIEPPKILKKKTTKTIEPPKSLKKENYKNKESKE